MSSCNLVTYQVSAKITTTRLSIWITGQVMYVCSFHHDLGTCEVNTFYLWSHQRFICSYKLWALCSFLLRALWARISEISSQEPFLGPFVWLSCWWMQLCVMLEVFLGDSVSGQAMGAHCCTCWLCVRVYQRTWPGQRRGMVRSRTFLVSVPVRSRDPHSSPIKAKETRRKWERGLGVLDWMWRVSDQCSLQNLNYLLAFLQLATVSW